MLLTSSCFIFASTVPSRNCRRAAETKLYISIQNRIKDYKKYKMEKFRIDSHWCRMVDFWYFGFKSHFLAAKAAPISRNVG